MFNFTSRQSLGDSAAGFHTTVTKTIAKREAEKAAAKTESEKTPLRKQSTATSDLEVNDDECVIQCRCSIC